MEFSRPWRRIQGHISEGEGRRLEKEVEKVDRWHNFCVPNVDVDK